MIRTKSNEEIIACIRSLNKKFLEFHRQNLEKLNSKKKMIPQLEEKLINVLPGLSQCSELCSAVDILYQTLNQMEKMISDQPLNIPEFYVTIV